MSSPNQIPSPQRQLAPVWHTVVITLCIVVPNFFLTSLVVKLVGSRLHSRPVFYLLTILLQWLLVILIIAGLRGGSLSAWSLVGRTWGRLEDSIRDVTQAGIFSAVVIAAGSAWYLIFGALRRPGADATPHTPFELLCYVPLAISTGISEEYVFRGYLLRQGCAFIRYAPFAVVLQAVIFSLGHGYSQTLAGFGHKLLLGLLYGLLAYHAKGLVPGMIAHSFLDLLSGFAGFLS